MGRKLGGLVACALALAFATGASSREASDEAVSECGRLARMAGTLMKARQNGAAMETMLAPVERSNSADKAALRQIVVAAYERPRYATAPMMQREVDDFSNAVHLECIKSGR